MFRIAVHNTNSEGPEAELFQNGDPFFAEADGIARVEATLAEYPSHQGYVVTVQHLVVDNPDDAPEAQTASWVEV